MKRYIVAITLAFVACFAAFAGSEDVVVWEEIYNQVGNDEQRVSIMMKIMELKDPEFAPMIVRSLDKVLSVSLDSGLPSERSNRLLLARLLVRELGNLKDPETVDLAFRAYSETKDPILKAEAARALGKMRAVKHVSRFADDLAAINLGPDGPRRRDQEIVALSLVDALELMRDPIGFEPVFVASTGWYGSSTGIPAAAERALVAMIDDPIDTLSAIIEKNLSMDVRSSALRAAMASKAPTEKKAALARRCLVLGIERATVDKRGLSDAMRFRVQAIDSLSSLQDKSVDSVPLLVQVVGMDTKDDASYDEIIRAYVALGVNGTDPAAQFLASKLDEYGSRETEKMNTNRDKKLIRQVLSSIKASNNPLVRNSLSRAETIDFDSGILILIREARQAIR